MLELKLKECWQLAGFEATGLARSFGKGMDRDGGGGRNKGCGTFPLTHPGERSRGRQGEAGGSPGT